MAKLKPGEIDVEQQLNFLKLALDGFSYTPPEGYYPLQKTIATCLNSIAKFAGIIRPDGVPKIMVLLDDAEVAELVGRNLPSDQLVRAAAEAERCRIASLLPGVE